MKVLLTTTLALTLSATVSAGISNCSLENEKERKTTKKEDEGKPELKSSSKNFHTIKKWKMRIEYTNGDIISKTIEVAENSSHSAMESAFLEAEKYIKTLSQVKWYEVVPVSKNKYVLLAND